MRTYNERFSFDIKNRRDLKKKKKASKINWMKFVQRKQNKICARMKRSKQWQSMKIEMARKKVIIKVEMS